MLNALILSPARRKLKVDHLARQPLVHLRISIESVVDGAPLLLIQNDLEHLGVVLLGAHALADNLDGVREILEDGVVHGSERAAARALLGLRVAGAVGALGAGQDAARGDEEDVAVGELLLELAGQAGGAYQYDEGGVLVEGVEWRWERTAAGPCGSQPREGRGRR
jgi:hypothetical protein